MSSSHGFYFGLVEWSFLKHKTWFWLFLGQSLTGIVTVKQAHLAKRENSHLGSKVAQHFCYIKLLTQQCAHAFAKSSCRIYTNAHTAVVPHLRPDPLSICSPNLAPMLPRHENTPSARVQPDNMNITIHTFTSWEKNTSMPSEKKSSKVPEGHRLCASKNVTRYVGTSPSHLDFLQPDIWLWLRVRRVELEVSAELRPGWLGLVIRGVALSRASSSPEDLQGLGITCAAGAKSELPPQTWWRGVSLGVLDEPPPDSPALDTHTHTHRGKCKGVMNCKVARNRRNCDLCCYINSLSSNICSSDQFDDSFSFSTLQTMW